MRTNLNGEGIGEEGEMFIHGLIRPQFVRTKNPRGINRLAKFSFRREQKHTLLNNVEPFKNLVNCGRE
jgi:hypothetical protein